MSIERTTFKAVFFKGLFFAMIFMLKVISCADDKYVFILLLLSFGGGSWMASAVIHY